MTKQLKDSEVPTEMMCDALGGCLTEAEEFMLPSLEAKIRDVRRLCIDAKDILAKIKLRIGRLSRKK